MLSLQNIQQLIDDNRHSEALDHIAGLIAADPENDAALYLRGKLYWRLQRYSEAVTDFEGAVALNPQSDARHALELARDVFNYFNPDLLNP